MLAVYFRSATGMAVHCVKRETRGFAMWALLSSGQTRTLVFQVPGLCQWQASAFQSWRLLHRVLPVWAPAGLLLLLNRMQVCHLLERLHRGSSNAAGWVLLASLECFSRPILASCVGTLIQGGLAQGVIATSRLPLWQEWVPPAVMDRSDFLELPFLYWMEPSVLARRSGFGIRDWYNLGATPGGVRDAQWASPVVGAKGRCGQAELGQVRRAAALPLASSVSRILSQSWSGVGIPVLRYPQFIQPCILAVLQFVNFLCQVDACVWNFSGFCWHFFYFRGRLFQICL